MIDRKQILFIGVGELGSKVSDNLNKEGYSSLAIHANYNLESKIQCPQINLMDRHLRQNEYAGFTENKDNIEELLEENKSYIKNVIKQFMEL